MKRKIFALAALAALASGTALAQSNVQNSAQKPAQNAAGNSLASALASVVGNWQGAITMGVGSLRIGLVITRTTTGEYGATLFSIDQGGDPIAVQQATLTGNALHLDIPGIKASYDGTLSANGQEMAGTFTQGMPTPLDFKRVDKLDGPPTFGAAEKAEVAELINAYFHAFTINDFAAFRDTLQVPFLGFGGVVTVTTTLDEVVARYQGIRNSLAPTDYAVSKAQQLIITPLSPNSALVDVHWRRDKKDGSLFGEGAEILMVSKSSGSWKITGNIAQQLSQYGKIF